MLRPSLEEGLLESIDVRIRDEAAGDEALVYEVNRLAFGSEEESKLVDRLRRVAKPQVSLVAVSDGVICGHILFSPVKIESGASDATCMGLGPMAVLPDFQNRGVGSRMVDEGLQRCRELGTGAIFVLGHPDYYPRFGFRPAAPMGLRYKNQRYDPYFFALELVDGALRGASGVVTYHPAFDQV